LLGVSQFCFYRPFLVLEELGFCNHLYETVLRSRIIINPATTLIPGLIKCIIKKCNTVHKCGDPVPVPKRKKLMTLLVEMKARVFVETLHPLLRVFRFKKSLHFCKFVGIIFGIFRKNAIV
jgi:hypothetical protein